MKARIRSTIHGPGQARKAAPRDGTPGMRRTVNLARFAVLLVFLALLVQVPFKASLDTETISTHAQNCAAPKTIFHLGDTVCAVQNGSPLGPPVQRRFEWVAPNGIVFQLGPDITSSPQNSSITIPITGPFALVGTWIVKTVDVSNNGYAVARFVVQDPDNPAVDLWVPLFGPASVSAGSNATFTAYVTNKGPNDAQNVQLTVSVATNTTFVSELQLSGPAFSCTDPPGGGTGSSTCTLATLPANATAVVQFVFQVDSTLPPGSEVTSTATVSSSTSELFADDNTSTVTVTTSTPTCDINCPGDITTPKTEGQCGAVVTYTTPTGSGDCGTIECDPPSGSFFPIGATRVVCFGTNNGNCAFTVTVQDTQPPEIHCPTDIVVNEASPGIGSAVVNYPLPTLHDNCPAPLDTCNPPSGSSFPLGATTVTCTFESTATCSFTVTVNSLVCILTCPEDVVVTENPPGSGSATVIYATPTTNGCPTSTITCNPPSGSTFSLGATTVNCTAQDESNNLIASCNFLVNVTDATPCTLTCPANVITPDNPPGSGSAVVNYSAPIANHCPSLTIVCSPPSGSAFPLGVTAVTCTGTSASGNSTSCSFTVTVNGSTPCTIACPANVSVNNAPNQCGAVVNYPAPTTAGSCGGDPPSCDPPSGSFFPVGTTVVICTSNGGAQCSFAITVLDNEKPTVGSSVSVSSLWPPNHDLINVGLAVTKGDNCDSNPTVQVLVFSDEDDLEDGAGNFSPDAKNIAPGTLRLRSERSGDGNGRVYLIIVKVTDAAGNVGFNCSTVVVPKSQSQADIDSANAQAVAARAFCLANNGAAPSGYFIVGDGPIVGPKQ